MSKRWAEISGKIRSEMSILPTRVRNTNKNTGGPINGTITENGFRLELMTVGIERRTTQRVKQKKLLRHAVEQQGSGDKNNAWMACVELVIQAHFPGCIRRYAGKGLCFLQFRMGTVWVGLNDTAPAPGRGTHHTVLSSVVTRGGVRLAITVDGWCCCAVHWFRERCLCKTNVRRLWEASPAGGRTQRGSSNGDIVRETNTLFIMWPVNVRQDHHGVIKALLLLICAVRNINELLCMRAKWLIPKVAMMRRA
ncbi:hypothetical protein V8E52_009514 [Russula decolorans]